MNMNDSVKNILEKLSVEDLSWLLNQTESVLKEKKEGGCKEKESGPQFGSRNFGRRLDRFGASRRDAMGDNFFESFPRVPRDSEGPGPKVRPQFGQQPFMNLGDDNEFLYPGECFPPHMFPPNMFPPNMSPPHRGQFGGYPPHQRGEFGGRFRGATGCGPCRNDAREKRDTPEFRFLEF